MFPVRHIAVVDAEFINLQRINGEQGLLPGPFLSRGVFDLPDGLGAGEMDDRAFDDVIADQTSRQQRPPMDTGMPVCDVRQRRIRFRILRDRDIFDIQ